jgi:hypothetical protein
MSDFWADLQRWTEAQVAAILRGRIGARRKDYLAADINKLLRDRITEPLTIKVGNKVLAEFLRNEGRKPQTLPEIPAIDHGWATGPYTDTVIYTWTSIAAVLSGLGYTLDGAGAYDSTVTRTASQTALYPEEYSGLTRLLVQAFVGSGRDITEIVPSGWSTAGTSLGLVRSPAGVYWLCNVGSGIGLKMSRLDVPEAMAPVAAKVQSGAYPAARAKLAEATVLGALTLASPEDTVTVLLHTELPVSDLYAASQIQQHWGGCWR